MQLNNLLSKRLTKSDQPDFLAINLTAETTTVATWQVAGTKAQVIKTGQTNTYSPEKPATLVEATQTSLPFNWSSPPSDQTSTVFSLPEDWVNAQGIKADKKPLLKHLSQTLNLKPIGFVVTTDAIAHHLNTQKGQSANALLVDISDQHFDVHLLVSGTIKSSQQVFRSDDSCADLKEAIARIAANPLPSTIWLTSNDQDLEDLQQEIIACDDWGQDNTFVHTPKTMIFTREMIMASIVETAGAEVIKTIQVDSQSMTTPSEPAPPIPEESLDESLDHNLEEPETTSDSPSAIPDAAEEFGFRSDSEFSVNQPNSTEEVAAELIDDQDHDNLAEVDERTLEAEQEDSFDSSQYQDQDYDSSPKPKRRLPKLSLPSLRLGRRPKLTPISIAITVLALLLLLAASAAAAYWYLPKATVSIFVKPTTKTQSLSFIASLDASSVSLEDNTVPAQNPQTEVTGTNQITATGEKLVGELASGTVTIFNRTNSAKTFEAGTKLTGPDSLVYTINEDVTVASASTKENADLSLVSQPSTVDVGVSAGNIGANHNLGSGTEFSVSNFDRSSYLARAKTDIAGGTSREITAVSQDDVDTLRQELITKLEEKAKAQITSGPSDLLAVAILNQAKPQIEETYSADVGDEAESVSLDAILTISTLTYKKSDIAKLIEGSIDLPEGKSLSANEIDIESISIEELEEGSYQIESRVNINIKPQLDTEDIARKLRGKYPAITESYFKSLPNFARVEIDITPDLPTKLKTFPRIVDNITVDVKLTE